MTRDAPTPQYRRCCNRDENGGACVFGSDHSALCINASIFMRLIAWQRRRSPVCDPKAAAEKKYNIDRELRE
jgi:hypothetical protein